MFAPGDGVPGYGAPIVNGSHQTGMSGATVRTRCVSWLNRWATTW